MSTQRDYYEILGVPRDASADQIKSAYRKIALKFHPDRNKGDKDAEAKFKEAAEAYSVLSDADKRKRYDQFGHAGVNSSGMGHGAAGGFSMEDIFRSFGDIFGGGGGGGFSFENLFGGGGRAGPRRGSSLRADLQVTLEEVATGVEKEIELTRLDTCETCDGSGAKPGTKPTKCTMCRGFGQIQQSQGFFSIQRTCPTCHGQGHMISNPCASCRGEGRVPKRERKKIYIPPGIEEGHVERLRGQGEAGEQGGPPGDLVLVIHVEEHAFFDRHGADLVCEMPIRFAQAALGGTIHVPTLERDDGEGKKADAKKIVEMKIPAGTQPGQILRLRGQGLPTAGGRGRGNLLVRVTIRVPTKLSHKQKEHLEAFDEVDAEHVDDHHGKETSKSGKGIFDKIKDMF
ncbi:MAG: molecular chaperone DnaJ [Planctomycetes bacterium]|nr:molecular chaperone DnaJ [Planctomycetota bacterium]MCB9918862.1 molecular chaperone DnaJ [Planctomycetota bacterium]